MRAPAACAGARTTHRGADVSACGYHARSCAPASSKRAAARRVSRLVSQSVRRRLANRPQRVCWRANAKGTVARRNGAHAEAVRKSTRARPFYRAIARSRSLRRRLDHRSLHASSPGGVSCVGVFLVGQRKSTVAQSAARRPMHFRRTGMDGDTLRPILCVGRR